MNLSTVVTPNQKGQVVIPQAMRKALSILPGQPLQALLRGGGIYLFPIEEVLQKTNHKDAYLEILKRTQGSWGPATKADMAREERKRQMELAASKRRKAQTW